MPIQRRTPTPKETVPSVWPEPDEASILALRKLCVTSPYFADVAEKVLLHASWAPGETVKIQELAGALDMSAGLLCKFLKDLAHIGAGRPFNRRPHLDDRVPYERFTWHVDFGEMIRRAVA